MLRDIVEVLALAALTAGGFMIFGPVALMVAGGLTLLALEVTDHGPSSSQERGVRGVRGRSNGRRPREGAKVLR